MSAVPSATESSAPRPECPQLGALKPHHLPSRRLKSMCHLPWQKASCTVRPMAMLFFFFFPCLGPTVLLVYVRALLYVSYLSNLFCFHPPLSSSCAQTHKRLRCLLGPCCYLDVFIVYYMMYCRVPYFTFPTSIPAYPFDLLHIPGSMPQSQLWV